MNCALTSATVQRTIIARASGSRFGTGFETLTGMEHSTGGCRRTRETVEVFPHPLQGLHAYVQGALPRLKACRHVLCRVSKPWGAFGLRNPFAPRERTGAFAMSHLDTSARTPSALKTTQRRQFFQAWGRMLAELRRLNEKAVDNIDDPEIAEIIDHMLSLGESIAVCMVAPNAFAPAHRILGNAVSIPHLGRIS